MTIAACLTTLEGVVLGTDSTTTVYERPDVVARVHDSGQKIFEIGPGQDRFITGEHFSGGIALYNAASFGPVSWRNAVNNFYRERIRRDPNSNDIPRQFLSYLQECWSGLQSLAEVPSEEAIPDAGFLIATIGKGKGEVEAGRIELREAAIEPLATGMLRINGGFEVVSRLLLGYDVGIEGELASVGIDVAKFKQCAEKFQAMPNIRLMPLRDAIDFVHFLVYSAIRLHRYQGAPSRLGGPIEIAVVTADRGFRWVVHKSLQGSIGIPGRNELP